MSKLTDRIKEELKPVNVEKLYDEMLDECFSFQSVGGIFAHMSPSRVLAECDPTAYRCGMNDYVYNLELIEIGSDYYKQDDCEEQRDELIEELDNQISDIESEIEELENGDDAEDQATIFELEKLKSQLKDLEEERKEIKDESL